MLLLKLMVSLPHVSCEAYVGIMKMHTLKRQKPQIIKEIVRFFLTSNQCPFCLVATLPHLSSFVELLRYPAYHRKTFLPFAILSLILSFFYKPACKPTVPCCLYQSLFQALDMSSVSNI